MTEIKQYFPLKDLTWMKVGGPADYYVEVRTKDELRSAFDFARKKSLPTVYLGQGSNMILPDGGLRGLVIRLLNDSVDVKQSYEPDISLVTAQSGVILSKLILSCRRQGLNGLNNFVGIPGTVGAAIGGNIGIPAQEIGEIVRQVEIYDGSAFRTLQPEECHFVYRGSAIRQNNWCVWSVQLLVSEGESPQQDTLLAERVSKQPKGHSCGSFFKNPDPSAGLFAGKLIDECGLKGIKKGGAFISEMHGNFLMNDGSASSQDVLDLAREVRERVLAKKGVVLHNEVLLYNEKGERIEL